MRNSSTTAAADVGTLWKAAKKHDAALVKQLILRASAASGSLAVVNAFHPRKHTTPLMAACQQRDTEYKHPTRSGADTVRVLLEFGADLSLQSRDRDAATALHFAAARNQVRAVEFMLVAGVDMHALDARGHAPIDVARWHKSRDVLDALTQHARIHQGWLYVKTAKVAQAAAPLKLLHVWKRRWAVALACDAQRRVVELSLFRDRGDVRPSRVVLLRADTHRLVASPKTKWLDRHNMFRVDRPLVVQRTTARRRFSRADAEQRKTERAGETELLQFAAETAAQREAWLAILRRSPQSAAHWAEPSPRGVVRVEPLVDTATTDASASASAYGHFGGTHAPLSPLGQPPAMAVVSPAQIAAAELVGVSPRHREQPSAPSFIGDEFYYGFAEPPGDDYAHPPPLSAPSSSGSFLLEPQRRECVVCLDAPRDAICVPCGHVAGCLPCLERQAATARACPICRAAIQSVLKIYEC